MFEGRHIDYRSSKVDTSITDLRRSTHRSSKVNTSICKGDTSIFESRHIDLRRWTHRDIDVRTATHRSSKGDTSIFESRHFDLRKSTHRSSKIEGGNITPTIRRRILSTTALLSPWSRRSYTRSYVHVELEFTYLSGLVINISLCIGYTICLYIAYIRPQPLGCLGSPMVPTRIPPESHPSGSFFILCEKKVARVGF